MIQIKIPRLEWVEAPSSIVPPKWKMWYGQIRIQGRCHVMMAVERRPKAESLVEEYQFFQLLPEWLKPSPKRVARIQYKPTLRQAKQAAGRLYHRAWRRLFQRMACYGVDIQDGLPLQFNNAEQEDKMNETAAIRELMGSCTDRELGLPEGTQDLAAKSIAKAFSFHECLCMGADAWIEVLECHIDVAAMELKLEG